MTKRSPLKTISNLDSPIRKNTKQQLPDNKDNIRRHVKLEYEESNTNAPKGWEETYELIKAQRSRVEAPVDVVGCTSLSENTTEPIRRYQTLISLMLSSQTRDEMTARAMTNLKQFGLTPTKIAGTPTSKLEELIRPVGFYKRKAQYIKETTNTLLEKYNGDIPETVEEMIKLKGVGPKMAYLTANHAWKQTFGIGVDVHVHRISNRLGWVDTKNPEKTREALESWLPKDKWTHVNKMLVGFGQTICKNSPKCSQCDINHLCPSSQLNKTSIKREKKAKKEENDFVVDEPGEPNVSSISDEEESAELSESEGEEEEDFSLSASDEE